MVQFRIGIIKVAVNAALNLLVLCMELIIILLQCAIDLEASRKMNVRQWRTVQTIGKFLFSLSINGGMG